LIQSKIKNIFNSGEKYKIIPIKMLSKLKKEIDQFKQDQELNNFQKWIVNELYRFDIPIVKFSIKSIILIAIPHPFYAEVEFIKNKKQYNFISLVMSDFEKTEKYLNRILQAEKLNVVLAQNLPLKRLAVQSGLASYGRNNICYINGMGSNFSFVAYYSDIPCIDEYWTDITMASICNKCSACLRNCPTGAIKKNKFLIDNERCLSYWNERSEPFPAWIPKSAHHCVYDCIKCQFNCPMNKDQIKNVVGPLHFTESETNMLLSGLHLEKQPVSFKQKIKYLGLHQWPEGISKNIKTLFEIDDTMK
jgi:epoxyqueuosine reductase